VGPGGAERGVRVAYPAQEAYRREVEQIRRWAKAAGLDEKVFTKMMTVSEIAAIIETELSKFYTSK
jgi:hypothetical protein